MHKILLSNNASYAAAVGFIIPRHPQKPQWISVAAVPTIKVWNLDSRRAQKSDSHGHCQGRQDLRGLLGCLYVARSNLVHGDKVPGDAVDIELCQNAFVILSNLLLNYNIKFQH